MAIINGTSGNNNLTGTTAGDLMHGLGGHDTVIGGSGNDTLYGDDGDDLVGGGAGNDYVNGGAGNDRVVGGSGRDSLFGGADNDTLDAGSGNDFLDGGTGNDSLWGGTGHDQLYGGDGDDMLFDGNGLNIFDGGNGNDTMFSWAHDAPDTLTGGADSDTFKFSTLDAAANVPDDWGTITDFDTTGRDADKIDLSDFTFDNMTYIGTDGFSGSGNSEVRYVTSLFEDTRVEIDIDGDGQVDGTITLQGLTLFDPLSADHFILI
jgi:Ca2+-binding RTX toxin-like protein